MSETCTETCVLYAEDDENDAFLLKHTFKQAKIENPLHIVTNGQEAIDYLSGVGAYSDRTRHPLPGVVILDLKMPHKTGLEVLEWIRQQTDLRVIVIIYTSSHYERDIDHAYELGASSFIVKPLDLQHMLRIAHAFKTWWLDCDQFTLCAQGHKVRMIP